MSNMLVMVLVVLVAILVLVGALGIGWVVLVKLGVITHYALKEEHADEGVYELDQSHESDDR